MIDVVIEFADGTYRLPAAEVTLETERETVESAWVNPGVRVPVVVSQTATIKTNLPMPRQAEPETETFKAKRFPRFGYSTGCSIVWVDAPRRDLERQFGPPMEGYVEEPSTRSKVDGNLQRLVDQAVDAQRSAAAVADLGLVMTPDVKAAMRSLRDAPAYNLFTVDPRPCARTEETDVTIGSDPVDAPSHYTRGSIEVKDFIADQGFGFFLGSAVKYISRAGYKGDAVEDLRKAQKMIDFEIELIEKQVAASRTRRDDPEGEDEDDEWRPFCDCC